MRQSRLLEGARRQSVVIRALILRELMSRYGRANIGFVWVILEPMILTIGVMIIWSAMGISKHGLRIVEIVLTGYMPLTLWRHLTNGGVNQFRGSASLLYHRSITLFDLLAARLSLEFIGTSAALFVVWSCLYSLGIVHGIKRPDLFIAGWLMMAWLGGVFCALIAVTTEAFDAAERFVQPFQYLNIPLSGAYFFVDWFPPWAQKLVLLNPMVHCYEVFRAGYFGPYITSHYDFFYFVICTFVLTFIAVVLVPRSRASVKIA